MTDDAFERSARRWMRAYPLWWRERRGGELLGVLEELADDGARRLDLRTGLSLVRGGWATRVRHRPPWHRVVLYRLGFTRLPAQFRWWAAQDIQGRFFPLREMTPSIGMLGVLIGLPFMWGPGRAQFSWLSLLGPLALAALSFVPAMDRRLRRLARERAFADRPSLSRLTDRPAPPAVPERLRPRRRSAARPGLARAAFVLGLGAFVLPVAAAVAPQRVDMVPCAVDGAGWCAESVVVAREPHVGGALVVWLALAVLAGAVVGVRAARRVRRASLPEQPFRQLAATRVPWGSLTATGAIGAVALGEATGALVQLFAAPLAGLCVVGLGLVGGQLHGLRGRGDVDAWALIDAWRVATSGVVLVDPPYRETIVLPAPPDPSRPTEGPVPG